MIRESDYTWFLVTVMAIGAGLASAVIFGVPWLWRLVKPWLHMVTA